MAEFVQLRLEEMLPEMEQMQRVQLFSEKEIKCIIKKRREHEYKLQKRTKQKGDYLRYAQYEIDLLGLLRLRRQKIGYHHKKSEIDHTIAKRITKIFTMATSRFPSDTKIWLAHIDFCKKMKWNSSISQIFIKLLKVKSNDPSLWIMAANWEFEENHSVSNGRNLLLRALRFHPNSIEVYTEAFRLELREADRLRKRREVLGLSCEAELPDDEEVKDKILDGQLATLFYDDAQKIVKSSSDLVLFLTVAKEFDFTQEIQQSIILTMKTKYEQDEVTWDTLGRSMLESSSSGENKNLNLHEKLKLCFSVYESAIEKLQTPKMWQLYVETLFELHNNENVKPKVIEKLKEVCHQAVSSHKLLENHIIDWFNLLEDSPYAVTRYKSGLENAVEQFPQNATLWIKYMKSLLEQKDLSEFICDDMGDQNETFEPTKRSAQLPEQFWKAVECVGPVAKAIPLWSTVIDHFTLLSKEQEESRDVVEQLYQRAIVTEPPISTHFKTRFLTWISSRKGLEEGRRFFREQANVPPMVLDFHLKMIEMETEAVHKDLKLIRKNFENACLLFGQNNLDIWFSYIEFELNHGDPLRVGRIHNRALSNLDASLADQFSLQSLERKLPA